MADSNVLDRMRRDWNERAREDPHYYVAFGRREQNDAEFLASAADVVRGMRAEIRHLRPACGLKALEIGCGPGRLMFPLSGDFAEVNVAAQSAAPGSILSLYRALLALRRAEPALSMGDYAPLIATEQVLAYERRFGPRRLLIVLNLTSQPARIAAPHSRVLLSTGSRRLGEEIAGTTTIAPNEGFIAEALG